jgi:hypothetical protein
MYKSFIMKKLLPFLVFLTLCISFESCLLSTQVLEHTSEVRGAIPPEFGQDTTATLLCELEDRRSYDRYLKKHVTEQYQGKYEFIQKGKLAQPPYNDIVKYPYVFGVTQRNSSSTSYDASAKRSVTQYSAEYYHFVLDRKQDKKYTIFFATSSFGLQIKSYMINLEKKRKSFVR